jgi:archaellum component FlaC
MSDTQIDALTLNINANAKRAVDALSRISASLSTMKQSAGGIVTLSKSIERLTTSLSGLQNTEKNLNRTVSAVRRLASVDFNTAASGVAYLGKNLNKSFNEMQNIGDNGIFRLINSITRLSKINNGQEVANNINMIGKSVNDSFKNMGDIDSSVSRLVSNIARIATAGEKIKVSASGFSGVQGMTNQLRNMIYALQQMGGVPKSINDLVGSLSKLATAGTKVRETAAALPYLSASVMQFMQTMQNAPTVSHNTLRMTEALASLAAAGRTSTRTINANIGTTKAGVSSIIPVVQRALNSIERLFKSMLNGFRRIGAEIKSKVSELTESLHRTSSISDGIKTIIGGYLGIQGLRRAFDWTKNALKSGADLAEINHIVEKTFGENSDAIKAWATTAMEQYGIAENNAKHYAGTLSAMFQASGVNQQATAKMATDLVGIAGDLSSFYNIDTAVAYEKVQAAMAGMVRPLRELGIDMSVASLEQFRMAQGIEVAYSKMSQADKTMLRYQYLMHVTSMQQGDFAKTSTSAANSIRIFKAYASAFSQTIGDALLSALRYAVWWLDKLMKYLLQTAKAFQTFMHTLFGANISGGGGAVLPDVGQMGLEDGADSASGLADGLGDAADNAKQLGKNLSVLPFDELNQLQKNTSDANSSAASGGSVLGSLGNIADFDIGEIGDFNSNKYTEAISFFAKRLKSEFENHNWYKMGSLVAEQLNKGISRLKKVFNPKGEVAQKIYGWCSAVGDTLRGFRDTLNTYNIGAVLGEMVTIAATAFNRFYDHFGGKDGFRKLGEKIADGVNGLADYIDWDELGKALGNGIMVAWNTFQGFVHRLHWDDIGRDLATLVNGFFKKFSLSDVMDTIATAINGMFTAIGSFAKTADWDGIGQNIIDGVNTFIDEFDGVTNGKNFNKFLSNFTRTFVKVMNDIKWEKLGKEIGDFISTVEWGDAFAKLAGSILKALLKTLKGLCSTPGGSFVVELIALFEGLKLTLNLAKWGLAFGSAFRGAPFVGALTKGLQGGLTKAVGGVNLGLIGLAVLAKGIVNKLHTHFLRGGHKTFEKFLESAGFDEGTAKRASYAIGTWWDILEGPLNKLVRTYKDSWVDIITKKKTFKEALLDFSKENLPFGLSGFVDNTKKKSGEFKKAIESMQQPVNAFKGFMNATNSTTIGATLGIQNSLSSVTNSVKNSTKDSVKFLNDFAGNTKENVAKSTASMAAMANSTEKNTSSSASAFDRLKINVAQHSGSITGSLATFAAKTRVQSGSVTGEFSTMKAQMIAKMIAMNNDVQKKFNSSGGIISKLQKAAQTIKGIFNFRWSLPDLKLPHITVGRYIKVPVLGTIPDPKTLHVKWYEKGGLFKGGSGQMIGVAENGKDEAVLPLENRRSMERIAHAIVSSGGMNSPKFAETIAASVAQAIISTQNDRPIVVQSTLRMENDEVIARAVTRGQKKLNNRFNY